GLVHEDRDRNAGRQRRFDLVQLLDNGLGHVDRVGFLRLGDADAEGRLTVGAVAPGARTLDVFHGSDVAEGHELTVTGADGSPANVVKAGVDGDGFERHTRLFAGQG